MKKSSPSLAELQGQIQDLQKALQQKEKEIYSIQRIGRALSSTLQLDNLLKLIMQEITVLMNADRSTLFLVDRTRGEIWSKIALKAEVKEIRQKLGKGISGHVALTGETINIPDAYQDDRFDPSTDKRTGYRTRSILCMPVWEPLSAEDKREIMGVIQVLNKKEGHFTAEDEALLETLASQVAISIANSRLYHQLEKKYREMDLLYEFEQLLSEVYQLDSLLKSLLQKTIQHLQAQWIGLCFPMEQQYVVANVEAGTDPEYRQLKSVPSPFQEWLRQSSSEEQLPEKEILEAVFNFAPEEPVLFTHLHFAEDQTGILIASGVESGDVGKLEDQQKMLELVGQKVTRAVELFTLRENLIKQERLSAIGKMLSTIVHDIRGPVNTIYGFIDLLSDEQTTAEERADFTQIIRQEVQSVLNMVTEVLDFAKGKTSILPRKTSVKKIMERFKPRLTQMCASFKTRLHLSVNSKQLLYADEEKIVRVLYNVAKNALEAMGEGGELFLNIQDKDSRVLFEIRDTGPGIPPEIQDQLFESFVTSGKESGTGLGLAIVKKIIDEHKGSIELESEVGKGATFRIYLPVYRKN